MFLKVKDKKYSIRIALVGLAVISLSLLGFFLLPEEIKDSALSWSGLLSVDKESVALSQNQPVSRSYFSRKEFYDEAYTNLPNWLNHSVSQ